MAAAEQTNPNKVLEPILGFLSSSHVILFLLFWFLGNVIILKLNLTHLHNRLVVYESLIFYLSSSRKLNGEALLLKKWTRY